MNVLDRMISVVSPERGVRRLAARQKLKILDSGYGNYGASHTKKSLLGWLYGGGSAKEDIQENLSTLRQRCRDLYMGVPLATGALKTCRTNVVGSGLRLKSQIDYEFLGMSEEEARDLESKIEREFALWADSPACDLERLDNFYELQQLAFLNWLMSGDVIATLPVTRRVNMPYDLRICLIEADRLSNPGGDTSDPHIVGGVETNDAGEVVAYHISKHHPLSYDLTETGWTRVKAWGEKTGRRNVLHVMNRERIGQRRGVPFLAPVIEALKQLGRYTDAELVAAVVSGITNARNRTVFKAAETGQIFTNLAGMAKTLTGNGGFQQYRLANMGAEAPDVNPPTLSTADRQRSVVIHSAPVFHVGNDAQAQDIEEILRKHDEELLQEIDERDRQRADDERRRAYD